jgi:hypothetical protein
MLICPAATARLLTDRMASQLAASVGVALLAAIGGYALATRAPAIFGTTDALSAAGMMAVVSGVLLTVAILVAPRHGVIARHVRRLALSVRIAREDLLAALYRLEEMGAASGEAPGDAGRLEMIGAILRRDDVAARVARLRARARKEVTGRGSGLALAPAGRALASSIIRSHRLWETYLVEEVGLRPDHVHETAMRLEHATTRRGERIEPEVEAALDPHGRAIPPDPIPPDRG